MPRAPAVSPSVITKAIESQKHVFTNGIPVPSASCWIEISKLLNHQITPKHLYMIVKRNTYDVQKIFKEESQNIIDNIISNEESRSEDDINENTIIFNITLSVDEWKQIGPTTKTYSCKNTKCLKRNYNVLEPFNWTNTIQEHFYEQTGIPCGISFKRCKVYSEGRVFVSIFGSCPSCKSEFRGEIENEPPEGSRVLIKCKYQGMYGDCRGEIKRRLIGRKRLELKGKLTKENMSASYIQRIEAKDKMRFGQKEPGHIPSLNALRVLKSKELQKADLHSDPVISVSILKQTSNYKSVIRDVCYDRFFIHYWSSAELNVYRQYVKRNFPSIISIDATGGVVKRPTLISGRKTSNIFLYEVVVMDNSVKRQYGVSHMLTERHDTNSISHWLLEWVKDGAPIPKIVVMDQSLALMSAAVKSFTQYTSLKMYLEVCSSWIIGCEFIPLPTTMIRNDFNHVMKLLSSWPEFKNSSYRIKNFYLRSIALLIQSKVFEEIKSLIKSIFIVALFETEGRDINTGQLNVCECNKQALKIKIAAIEDIPNTINNDNNENENEIELNECNIILDNTETSDPEYFEQIKLVYQNCINLSKKYDNGDRDNHQYNIKIAEKLLKFCRLLPCWSAVMVPYFGFGNTTQTSASSESQFNDLKNRVFKHLTLPIRIDRFLITHINSFTGTMNLVASDFNGIDICIRGSDNGKQNEIEENVEIEDEGNTQLRDEHNLEFENEEHLQTDFQYNYQTESDDILKIVEHDIIQTNGQDLNTETEENSRNIEKKKEDNVSKTIEITKSIETVHQQRNNNDDLSQHIITTPHVNNENMCIACINKHIPIGAHKCALCSKAVHIIDGCSFKLHGQEEGFGEKRVCVACFKNNPQYNELIAEENWKGETRKIKKGPNYLQNDPSILFYNDASKTKSPVIGILKNGNRSNLKSIRIGGLYYTASNTCAFDSIFHILCTSYCDSTAYAEYINANRNNLIFMMVSNAIKDGINVQTYRKRITILKDICELQELPEKLINIRGDNPIEVMTRKTLENMPSRIDIQNCINCPNQQISQQPILLSVNNIRDINKLLIVDGNINKCVQCNRRLVNPYR